MRKLLITNRMRTNWLRTKREIDQVQEPLAVKKPIITSMKLYENITLE